jgi:catechol 2,3-dioxygenase-like lactoylglutathione lyase family enzyme
VELVEVVLYVRDMDTSIRFYRDTLGLAVGHQSAGWTTFRTGACVLALHVVERRELGAAEPDPTFLVDDATVERERLIRAGVEVSDIREPVAGTRVFDARDPDGNRLSLESRSEKRP